MEVSLSRRSSLASRAMRFVLILLSCLLVGFVSYGSYAHAESNQVVATQDGAATAAPADEGENFFIFFMVFVVLLVIIVVVIVASSTSASSAAIPSVFERWEE